MRRTVLLLLLVAFAKAAPVAEDADQKNILQMLLTADPQENDIIDNNIIEKSKIIENEELTPTTEYVLGSEIESSTETVQDEPKTVEEDKNDTDSETESETELDSGSSDEVAESVPEVSSNNATISDTTVEIEQQEEPTFDTEIIEIIQLGENYAPTIPESPEYAINIPEVTPELETTDTDESSIEGEYESSIEDEKYSNQEWPQRYAPGFPNYFDINAMKPESQLLNNQELPQRYAPSFPETQQYGQAFNNIPNVPQMSSNIFENQEIPFEYVPEMQDTGMMEPVGPAYQAWDVQGPGQYVDNGPIVDTFPDVYPEPVTFMNYPEVNHFGEDGMAHGVMEDITIEPIFFNQEPIIYDNTPELSMNEELPEEILEITDLHYDANADPEDAIELIVLDEQYIDVPQGPIAGEAEQPQDSPIIATAILQDTRPDVDLLGLFNGPEDTVIPEIIEETPYPLENEDIVEEYLLASEDLPYQPFDQDVITTDNDSFAIPNTPEFEVEEDFVMDPFAKLPPLVVGLEQAAFPEMPLVNEPSVTPFENGPFSPMNENEQRIYFQDEIPEFPSEPDFMGPHSHDEFSFHNDNFQPHSHNENMNYHYENYDIPHAHHDHQYNFDNFPRNSYFEEVRGTRKRDGAHMVPEVDVIELPIIETGEMGNFNSPMMGPRNPGPTPQITVIIASKPQLKEIWSQFIHPLRQKQYSSVDMTLSQDNVPQFGNMGQYSQKPNTNQFRQNFNEQHFNEQPLQNYNMNQNMNFPQNQLFNSGMDPYTPNFNQQPNMGSMFPNLNMDMPSFEDLPAFVDEEIERAEQMFASSQQPLLSYGPPSMYPGFSNKQQAWPTRYSPNYSEFNYLNNAQFYPQRNMNNQYYIP